MKPIEQQYQEAYLYQVARLFDKQATEWLTDRLRPALAQNVTREKLAEDLSERDRAREEEDRRQEALRAQRRENRMRSRVTSAGSRNRPLALLRGGQPAAAGYLPTGTSAALGALTGAATGALGAHAVGSVAGRLGVQASPDVRIGYPLTASLLGAPIGAVLAARRRRRLNRGIENALRDDDLARWSDVKNVGPLSRRLRV